MPLHGALLHSEEDASAQRDFSGWSAKRHREWPLPVAKNCPGLTEGNGIPIHCSNQGVHDNAPPFRLASFVDLRDLGESGLENARHAQGAVLERHVIHVRD